MRYFTSSEDLALWVLSNGEAVEAITRIYEVIGKKDLSVKEGCEEIFRNNSKDNGADREVSLSKGTMVAAEALLKSLSRYGLTETQKNGEVKMSNSKKNTKEAQYRHPGPSVTYNRETDNAYNDTPWRKDRDAMYGFIHRNPDMISFSEDPNMVYSGEALWRAYVMDKFYRDYKDDSGRVVGGYINDRFQVFHDVGGNQMQLANGERTRKPRPHQFSIERRLEEDRGNKCEDIRPLSMASSKDMVKIASKEVESIEGSDVFEMFKDVIDMRQAGVKDEDIICKIAEHYSKDVLEIASLHKLAVRQTMSHKNIVYAASSEDLKKKARSAKFVGAASVDNVNDLLAVPGASILPVYNQNGNFTIGKANQQVELNQPIRVFPVNGAYVNSSPVFSANLNPDIVGVNFPKTMFFTLSNASDMEDQIMNVEAYQDMLTSTSETGLVDLDENQISQMMSEFSKKTNPVDQKANQIVEETVASDMGVENTQDLANLAQDSIDSIQSQINM